ncbi:MAG: hypothetical protein MZV70_47205 [Desulfobacterales bacterium]|nr:hypothetical protein [Desulfobacterales bacterium]
MPESICAFIQKYISDYIDSKSDACVCRQFSEHLIVYEQCRSICEDVGRSISLLDSLGKDGLETVESGEMKKKVLHELRKMTRK